MSDSFANSPTKVPRSRNRPTLGVLILLTIALGLTSRRYAMLLPMLFRKSAGDALWAMMVFFGTSFLYPRWKTRWIGAMAMAFSITIEFTQLYHAPWIDSMRSHALGHLVLGSGFAWRDIAFYATGVLAGVGIDRVFFHVGRDFHA